MEGTNTGIAKVTEIIATSGRSYEDAVKQGVKRAWVTDHYVKVNKKGEISQDDVI